MRPASGVKCLRRQQWDWFCSRKVGTGSSSQHADGYYLVVVVFFYKDFFSTGSTISVNSITGLALWYSLEHYLGHPLFCMYVRLFLSSFTRYWKRRNIARLLSRPSITSSSSSSSSSQRMDPRTAAAKFIREFETKYNSETHVPFFEGGYSQALETARRDLRFLLVVLQCDEHDDTDKFCR